MSDRPRSVLGLVFLTVFLDIVGFSVIFPLFPGMLDYYFTAEGADSLIGQVVSGLQEFAGDDRNAVQTLFGGLLGSVYGLLQFVFATVWGGLSDRIGRRPVLLITLSGTFLAYLLWAAAASFWVLVLARVLGGAMAGNICRCATYQRIRAGIKSAANGRGASGRHTLIHLFLTAPGTRNATTCACTRMRRAPGMGRCRPTARVRACPTGWAAHASTRTRRRVRATVQRRGASCLWHTWGA